MLSKTSRLPSPEGLQTYRKWHPSILPRTQTPAKKYQLAEMIGVVIGNQECFPHNRLTVTVRNPGI